MGQSKACGLCGALILSLASLPAARARAASPEALRGQAVKLMEKARSPQGDMKRDMKLAREKVERAIAIIKGKSSRSGKDEELLTELQSLLYWIRKMTPISVALKPQKTPGPAEKPEARPPEKTPSAPPRRPEPPPPPAPRATFSRRFPGLPAYLEPVADTVMARYERGYSTSEEVDEMRHQFFLLDMRQVFFLRKYPRRPLEAATLVFQAVDENSLSFIGEVCSVARMQACLELDRLYHTKPGKGLSSGALRVLRQGFGNLAACACDFEPAVEYFKAVQRGGLAHSDVKLGLALAELAQGYFASQARLSGKRRHMVRLANDKFRKWLGSPASKLWVDAFNKYANWTKEDLTALSEDSRRLFREYAKEQPRGDIYEAFSECFWLWYWGNYGEFDAKAKEAYLRFDDRERTDAEKTMMCILVNLWMRVYNHVDGNKVKWD